MENQLLPHFKGRKPSEVFMEYVEPFLQTLLLDRADKGIHDTPTLQEFESILRMPWCIWNAIVAEEAPGNKIDLLAWMDSLIPHIPDSTKKLLEYMKRRKRNQFGQYQYYLGKYKFYYDEHHEIRLRIETSLPNTAP